MSKEYHYVISYSTESKKWKIDVEVEESRFENEMIYDTETNEWSSGYLGDGKYDELEDELTQQVNKALEYINEEVK